LRFPFSKEARISRSYASTFGILRTLLQIIPRRFATRDDGFKKEVIVFFNEGDEIDIAIKRDNENLLIRIFCRIRVLHDVEQTPRLNSNNDAFERQPPDKLQRLVFLNTPSKRLHEKILLRCVPFVTSASNATYNLKDFRVDASTNTCTTCPEGENQCGNGSHCVTKGRVSRKFTGNKSGCGPCQLSWRERLWRRCCNAHAGPQVQLVINKLVQGVLEAAGLDLRLENNGDALGTSVYRVAAGHVHLRSLTLRMHVIHGPVSAWE
jgi:hypothetical protein